MKDTYDSSSKRRLPFGFYEILAILNSDPVDVSSHSRPSISINSLDDIEPISLDSFPEYLRRVST